MPELYAATPPLECLRMLVPSAMHLLAGEAGTKKTMKIMVCDVSRVYCYAPAIRPVYVKMVDEDFEEGGENRCGKLNVSMYGTRDAAFNLHLHCNSQLGSIGFVQGNASLCIVHNPQKSLRPLVRGDDYVIGGHPEALERFSSER